MTGPWSTPADIAAKVRRRWDDGTLLRSLAAGGPFPAIELPLRGPRPAELGDDLDAVRRWIAVLEAGSRAGAHYELILGAIGGRHVGRNQIPTRARVGANDQAWSLLGVQTEVAAFLRVLELSESVAGARGWVVAHPLAALALAEDWGRMLSALTWLESSRGSHRYLREISAPGVDTKFVERHRGVLAELLNVPRSSAGFLTGLGLRAVPDMVRLRFDPQVLALPDGLTEATFRVAELGARPVKARSALVVENEVTYLSVPVPEDGVVLWGKGFEVDRVGALPWLAGIPVRYWGDLDTHGFAILDRLRSWLPGVTSILMDRQTLLEHRNRWVVEPAPTAASLTRLDPTEASLYEDLVTDRLGESVRLEQERIDWTWAVQRL